MTNNRKRECLAVILALLGLGGLARVVSAYGIDLRGISETAIWLTPPPTPFLSEFITLPSSLSWKLKMYFPAILWCVSASWLGIAAWLWNTRRDCTEGFRKIVSSYYIFMPILISSAVFSLATHLDPSLDVKFYSTSFALGLILGFLGKDFWSLLPPVSKRREKFPRSIRTPPAPSK